MSRPVAVLLYGAGEEMRSLQVPAKELSAAVGISLLFYIPPIHFWHLQQLQRWRDKRSSLGA